MSDSDTQPILKADSEFEQSILSEQLTESKNVSTSFLESIETQQKEEDEAFSPKESIEEKSTSRYRPPFNPFKEQQTQPPAKNYIYVSENPPS